MSGISPSSLHSIRLKQFCSCERGFLYPQRPGQGDRFPLLHVSVLGLIFFFQKMDWVDSQELCKRVQHVRLSLTNSLEVAAFIWMEELSICDWILPSLFFLDEVGIPVTVLLIEQLFFLFSLNFCRLLWPEPNPGTKLPRLRAFLEVPVFAQSRLTRQNFKQNGAHCCFTKKCFSWDFIFALLCQSLFIHCLTS